MCEFHHKIAITELQGPLLWIQEHLQGKGGGDTSGKQRSSQEYRSECWVCEIHHKIAITELQGPLLVIQQSSCRGGGDTHHENNTAAARIVGANAGCELKHNTGPPGAPGASAGAPGAARNRVANAGC